MLDNKLKNIKEKLSENSSIPEKKISSMEQQICERMQNLRQEFMLQSYLLSISKEGNYNSFEITRGFKDK